MVKSIIFLSSVWDAMGLPFSRNIDYLVKAQQCGLQYDDLPEINYGDFNFQMQTSAKILTR